MAKKTPGFMKSMMAVKPPLPNGKGIGKPHMPVKKKAKKAEK